MVLAFITAAAITACALAGAAAPAVAAVDPERNASEPTAWHWSVGTTADDLSELEDDTGERVIAINVDDPITMRLSAATVDNSGTYARKGD